MKRPERVCGCVYCIIYYYEHDTHSNHFTFKLVTLIIDLETQCLKDGKRVGLQ